MRIERPARSPAARKRFRTQVARAAEGAGVRGRVCGDSCTLECRACRSPKCQCVCSPQCSRAPHALSGDPAHPIEPAIVALTYEMKRTGLFVPCWSCEGHLHPDGSLFKLPGLWFYCDDVVALRLLAKGLSDLKLGGRLSARWQISITYSDPDNPETTFALEPAPAGERMPPLGELQRDLAEIARTLEYLVRAGARDLERAVSRAR